MNRKERIEKFLQQDTPSGDNWFSIMVNDWDKFIQEEVDPLMEALERIAGGVHNSECNMNQPITLTFGNRCNCHVGIAQKALSGKSLDPSRAELIYLVKGAFYYGSEEFNKMRLLGKEEYPKFVKWLDQLEACNELIKKLEVNDGS